MGCKGEGLMVCSCPRDCQLQITLLLKACARPPAPLHAHTANSQHPDLPNPSKHALNHLPLYTTTTPKHQINNAGIYFKPYAPQEHKQTVTTNTEGPISLTLALLPHFAKGARVVMVSSGGCRLLAAAVLFVLGMGPKGGFVAVFEIVSVTVRAPTKPTSPTSHIQPHNHKRPGLGALGMVTDDYSDPLTAAQTVEDVLAAALAYHPDSPLPEHNLMAPSYSVSKAALNRCVGRGAGWQRLGGGLGGAVGARDGSDSSVCGMDWEQVDC